MSEDHAPTAAVVGNFEFTAVLTDKRQLRMTGYVYSDDDPHKVDDRLDTFQASIDRQMIRADIVNKEAESARIEASLEALIQHNEELLSLSKAGKLTSSQKQQLGQFESSVRFHKKQKESLAAAVNAAKKKLNGAAA